MPQGVSTAAATPGCSGLNLVEGRKPLLPKVKGGKGRDAVPPLQGPPRAQSMGAALTHLPHLFVQATLCRGPLEPSMPIVTHANPY